MSNYGYDWLAILFRFFCSALVASGVAQPVVALKMLDVEPFSCVYIIEFEYPTTSYHLVFRDNYDY